MSTLAVRNSRIRFEQYAWGLLAYTLAAVLWGAFVRATFSGDGCGANWPLCSGQVATQAGELKRLVEGSHRLSTGILLPLALLLIAWSFRRFPKGHHVRRGAVSVLVFVVVEALVGAALVLFRWVAHDQSVYRAVAMPTHLAVTFGLLASLALTAWWASGGAAPRLRDQGVITWAAGAGLCLVVLLGASGALTALGDMLFPALSLVEGLKQDFQRNAHFLQSLKVVHPVISMCVGLYLVVLARLLTKLRPSEDVQRFAGAVTTLFLAQMGAGILNAVLGAPLWMQLLHLLFADLTWISLVLMCAAAVAESAPRASISKTEEGAAAPLTPRAAVKAYVALTKPRVISLLLFTTWAAMYIAAGGTGRMPGFWLVVATGLGLYMAAGAANAINMVLERDLDLSMGRTATRPTVTQAISARNALIFAAVLMVGSFGLLWGVANLLTAVLAQAGLAFYVVVYTLLLKRRTWTNIVIGGAAGAFPPLVGWAAVTGDLSPLAWVLFGIIFLWTPVHFWALAILIKEDYARAGVPMLPVVRGDRATVAQILHYTVLTAAFTAIPLMLRTPDGKAVVGWFYIAAAVVLNGFLFQQSARLFRSAEKSEARSLFKYSMVYLALLFLAMAVDRCVI